MCLAPAGADHPVNLLLPQVRQLQREGLLNRY